MGSVLKSLDNVWCRCDSFQRLPDKNGVKICIDDELLTMMCGIVKGQRHPGYIVGLEKIFLFVTELFVTEP